MPRETNPNRIPLSNYDSFDFLNEGLKEASTHTSAGFHTINVPITMASIQGMIELPLINGQPLEDHAYNVGPGYGELTAEAVHILQDADLF